MTLNTWYLPSLVSLMLYGCWGYWGARASSMIKPLSTMVYSCLGAIISASIALFLLGFKPEFSAKGGTYSMLNGLAGGIGYIFFIMALRKGPAMPVILVTSMYPLITLALCMIFLKQDVSVKQWIGMGFAMVALVLLAME